MPEEDINNSQVTEKLPENGVDSILKQFTRYQGILIGSSKELALQIKDANEAAGKIDTKVQGVVEQLTGRINELHSEVLLLRSIVKNIPESIAKEVSSIVPKVSSEIQRIYQNELKIVDEKLEEHNTNLIGVANKATTSIERLKVISDNSLDSLMAKSKKIGGNYFRKLGVNILVASLMSAIVGATASYFMVKRFPTRVFVDQPNSVTIDKSSVQILKKEDKNKK